MPWGCVDRLPGDARRMTRIEDRFRDTIEAWGYDEVITPVFEPCDAMVSGGIDPAWLFRFAGPDGEMVALRPDLTTPIARVVSTRMREATRPLRFYYAETVFRRPEPSRGRAAELRQAGIELVGSDRPDADAEAVAAAIEMLRAIGPRGFQLNLGQIGFFEGLIHGERLSAAEVGRIRDQLDRKDRDGLARTLASGGLPASKRRLIEEVLSLIGGEEILDRAIDLADNDASELAARRLKAVYEILADFGLADAVVIDLTEVRGFGYYTGLMFEGFAKGAGAAILSGGRYDNLIGRFGGPCPAVGWALDLDRVLSLVRNDRRFGPPPRDVLVRFAPSQRGEAYRTAQRMRREGRRVELEIEDRSEGEAIEYAAREGIGEVLEVGPDGARPVSPQERIVRPEKGGTACRD